MNCLRLCGLTVLLALNTVLLTLPTSAQVPEVRPKVPPRNAAAAEKTSEKAEADRAREGRLLQVRTLLLSLSGEARGFSDQKLRARSLARIADALWDIAPDQGRILFRDSWSAAVRADQEGRGELNLRREVLTATARRDRQLAEEFLQKLTAEQESNKVQPVADSPTSEGSIWRLPEAGEQRLGVAQNLLSAGDVDRALQFADPVLNTATISTVDFLTRLREKDPVAADRRYAAMLASAGGSAVADANAVSVLSSYIFTPRTYVVFGSDGQADAFWMNSPLPPARVEPPLRHAFFQTAGTIFLRPQPSPEQGWRGAGVAAKYAALKRLMPLFQQYAPPDAAGAMRGLLESLSTQVGEDVRQRNDELARKGLDTDVAPAEHERSLLEGAEAAKTPDESDQLYFRLALLALGNDDRKALDYVGKIGDDSFRRQARAWVVWGLILRAVEKKRPDDALELSREGELTRVQRVWVLTQSAKLLAKSDREQALPLLDKARAEARLIDRGDAARPRCLLAVANALRLVEPPQVWGAVSDAVEAANWIEDFTGEGGEITQTLSSKSQIMNKTDAAPDFDIRTVFGGLASIDIDHAIQAAQTLKGEAARTNAILSVAQSVLSERNAAPAAPQRATKK